MTLHTTILNRMLALNVASILETAAEEGMSVKLTQTNDGQAFIACSDTNVSTHYTVTYAGAVEITSAAGKAVVDSALH